ncbi:hypothetical protein BD309DRAFT_387557 [Dichomitus squalens]|uniref:Uncharacterized protein n=1 Tax=Dichomitus squalens TaxID=114155 RepID=A0A4V2K989_9APHY|nr:hypothetical protein BD309DRAFT_387557 [Dichomitus squalens]TBU62978.1 hypothetical protein BD310DRAFT_662146 [Dichomitus squalens]
MRVREVGCDAWSIRVLWLSTLDSGDIEEHGGGCCALWARFARNGCVRGSLRRRLAIILFVFLSPFGVRCGKTFRGAYGTPHQHSTSLDAPLPRGIAAHLLGRFATCASRQFNCGVCTRKTSSQVL